MPYGNCVDEKVLIIPPYLIYTDQPFVLFLSPQRNLVKNLRTGPPPINCDYFFHLLNYLLT